MSVVSHICLVNIFFAICRLTNTVVYEVRRGTSGNFSSPGFPNRYASNGTLFQFIFRVTPYYDDGIIRLSFTDLYLSKYSKLTIYPNGSYSDKNIRALYFQAKERPVAYSSGPALLVIFDTGFGDTTRNYIGFKAEYTYAFSTDLRRSYTDQMGLKVSDIDWSGQIFMDMIFLSGGVYDYVWVIFNAELIDLGANVTFTIYRIMNMTSVALEVRTGPTSESSLTTWNISLPVISGSGFHIRFKMDALPRTRTGFYADFAWTYPESFTTNSITSTTNATTQWSNSDNFGNNRYAVVVVSFVVPIVIIIIIIVWPILCIIYCCPKCCRTPGDADEDETPSEERSTGGNVSNDARDPTTSVMDLPPSSYDLFVYDNPVFTNPEPPAPPPYSTVVGARGSPPDPKDDSPPPYSAIHMLSTSSHSSTFI